MRKGIQMYKLNRGLGMEKKNLGYGMVSALNGLYLLCIVLADFCSVCNKARMIVNLPFYIIISWGKWREATLLAGSLI